MGDTTLKPEVVSQYDIVECSDYLDKNDINYEHLETVEEMRERIKQHLEELKAKSKQAIECDSGNETNGEKNVFSATMGDTTLKPEVVSQYDIVECSDYLDKNDINYEHLETVEEMRERIKQHLEELKAKSKPIECDSGNETNGEKNSQILMHEILSQDQKMKDELSEIYISLLKFVTCEIDDEIKSVIEEIYGDLGEVLVKNKAELTSNECPIVVAGEVSAGKSSLLNLILGTNVLPHSLLCATSTICRLHNSQDKRFEILKRNGEIITVNIESESKEADKELTEKLKPYVSSTESRQENKFKQVDIYWPIPMLQDRVTIVDTPGVGESEEMTERLLEYLPNAVAFIYVVNSANAGGIQEDRVIFKTFVPKCSFSFVF